MIDEHKPNEITFSCVGEEFYVHAELSGDESWHTLVMKFLDFLNKCGYIISDDMKGEIFDAMLKDHPYHASANFEDMSYLK